MNGKGIERGCKTRNEEKNGGRQVPKGGQESTTSEKLREKRDGRGDDKSLHKMGNE